MAKQKIPATPSVRRLPSYLNIIRQIQKEGGKYISGTLIAQELSLEPIQVRKDLAITGVIGKPKKGYPINTLISAIERFLGWDSMQDVILVGAGNLGSALMGHQEFRLHGLHIVAAFDKNLQKSGTTIHGVRVFSIEDLETEIHKLGVKVAILTIHSSAAQETTDILVKAGILGIWNFTSVKLRVPESVVVQTEDLSSGYAMLCVSMQSRQDADNGTAP
ncbi:redox-sensing transcriptional repressor Rex [Treponema primitia]|uniref:redox-sensing transcriptional repressor Rex n=1 Tax=Treponema primitia TaxID=88058 RepID=UPI00025557DD|nr:redox-sensing transcriptional repressor Rex [Treponema primitia]